MNRILIHNPILSAVYFRMTEDFLLKQQFPIKYLPEHPHAAWRCGASDLPAVI